MVCFALKTRGRYTILKLEYSDQLYASIASAPGSETPVASVYHDC
jgi:hypothetical protein